MKILFVTPPPYLPNRLHRTRSFDLLKMLAKKYEIHLLAVTTKKDEPKEFEEIRKICKSVTIIHINFFQAIFNCLHFPILPLEVAFCYSSKVAKKMQEIVKEKNIDLIYLKRLRSAIYLSENLKTPIVLDITDAMSMFYKRMSDNHFFPKNIFYSFEAIKYKLFEKKMMKKIKHWIVCSEVDKKYLENFSISLTLRSKNNFYVIPNSVDTRYFKPLPITNHQSLTTNHSLLFRGLMDKPVNITAILFFVKQVFPLVKKEIPDVELYIVGPSPKPIVKELELKDKNHIIVTGFVKDIREYIAKNYLSVCPILIGSGTRHKILQSLIMSRPVVSTIIGAEGLGLIDNKNILIADDPKEFADKIISLFKDKKLYNKIVKNGYLTVKNLYSLSAVEKKLEKVIKYVKK